MEDIVVALEKIEEKGSFCGKRTMPTDHLHLEVKDFGLLKFPLSTTKVKALIKFAKPAKFGWRDQTLQDKNVRDAWEISKSKIKIESGWNKELSSVLDLLKNDLGLSETAKLKANLHNLLIYEPGQFFEYHQDSEKLDGMVASLVVVLPSKHSGGSLIIDHHGVKKQFKTSQFPLDKLSLIAFYADCHHEVKAIIEGYRVALTYNLVLEQNSIKPRLSKASDTQSDGFLIPGLRAYFAKENNSNETSYRDNECPQKLVYLLDHSYTQKGLSWDHLKNADSLRAAALKKAAEELGLEAYLVLADVQETWDCEEDYDNYRYSRRRRYYEEEDEEDEEEHNADNNDVQVNDLIDSNTTIKHWLDIKNKKLNYKECYVSDNQICWTKATDEFEPFESHHEGYMGNYGNTMDRWYHRAAIVLWKKEYHYPVLFKMDANSVIDELIKLTSKKSQETNVHSIIKALLPYWSSYMQRENELPLIRTVIKLAIYVNDQQLAHDMIKNFNINALNPETTTLLLDLLNYYGVTWCLTILKEWAKSKNYGRSLKCVNISRIVTNLSEKKNKNKELTDWVLLYQFERIKEHHTFSKKHDSRVQLINGVNDRINELMDLISACIVVDNHVINATTIHYIIDNMELYPVLDLINVLHSLNKDLQGNNLGKWEYNKLRDYIVGHLHVEHETGLRKPDDWSIKGNLSCACEDCIVLKRFLQSSTEKEKIWPLAEARRSHIHQKIDGLGIPVTHQTERKGSPYRLILTKTDKLYQQAKLRFEKIEKELCKLTKMVDS